MSDGWMEIESTEPVLSRRDEFAKAAMQGLLSCVSFRGECAAIVGANKGVTEESVAAHFAVKQADALISELDKEQDR